MNKMKTKKALLLAAGCWLLFSAGCGSAPVQPSDTHLKAVELNNKAEAAFGKADYKQALALYSEALRIDRSIENIDGIAINLINMASVYRELRDMGNAHKFIDEVLSSSLIAPGPSLLSEAAFIKASVCADEARYDLSAEWADKALSFCTGKDCAVEGRAYNLKARLALLRGDPASALGHGGKGLELNKDRGDSAEIANSLRLIAAATAAKGDMEGARKFYEDALSLDKASGLSRKVIIDLTGIGDILAARGRDAEAMKYYQRALSAAGSAGAEQAVKDITSKINGLDKKPGK